MPTSSVPIHPEVSQRPGSANGIPVREDVAYSNQRGEEKDGTRKRAEKAIEQLREILARILEPGETILYVALARRAPSGMEQFFLGWLAQATEAETFVLTNLRLIALTTDKKGAWKRSVRAARWEDVEKADAKGFLGPSVQLKFRDGSQENFWKLRRDDAKKLKVLFPALVSAGGAAAPGRGMVNLCPNCVGALTPAVYKCGKCGLDFKNEKTLVRRSLAFPGLGYFYAGHPGLGVLDMLIEAFIVLEIAGWTAAAFGYVDLVHEPGTPDPTPGEAWVVIAVLLGFVAVKKWLIIRHCRRFVRGFIPVS